ncbi:MAG: hypothetical protein LBH74_02000, partial [Nitrososphaerota archaeon]|nr:hypothetical protein [Nitrososphaerota archaeon]
MADETALRDAVTGAMGHTIIALTHDIQLTSTPLNIATGKDITLISNGTGEFFKLIGASGTNTITISTSGILDLDGVIVTHNSGALGRGVYVDSGATLTLSSGEITENNVYTGGTINDAQYGGGVYNWGTFTINGGTISNNSAYNGAGVYSIVTCTMNEGTFSENTAAGAGGGVANLGTLKINNGLFYKNQAVNGGGVFSGVYSNFTLNNGDFLENQAINGAGGGVYNDAFSTFAMINGTLSKNHAVAGGGVYNLGTFELIGGLIGGATLTDGNIATDSGGGVCDDGFFSVFNMHNGVISNNTAANYGGGIESAAGVFNLFGGKISNNFADFGGGVFIWDTSTVNIEGGTLLGNTATYYGGGVYNYGGTFTISDDNTLIADNKAAHDGGGVYNDGSFVMSGGVIANNTAITNGGGVYNAFNANFNMTGGIIGGNNSTSDRNSAYNGGGVYNDHATFTMTGDAAVLGNRATFGGGMYNNGGTFDLGAPQSSVVHISGNTATHNGGGVYNTGSSALFNMFSNASVISNNSAGIDGGGVFNVNAGVFNMFGGGILGNSAGTGGGGVDTSGEFTLFDGKISGNSAHGAGGVLNYHNFNMLGGEITDNNSTGYAGGVENNGSSALGLATFNMSGDAIIANNTATFGGGGVYNAYNAIFNMFDMALISGNSAATSDNTEGRGGGVHNNDRATLNMFDHAVISNNFAIFGGGVFNDINCTSTMSNDTAILDNTAASYGGGVYNWNPYTTSGPSIFILSDRATISGNSATSYGGGVQNTNNGILRIFGDAVISNNSALYGGGIYTISALSDAVTIDGGTIANNSARSGGGVYTNSELTLTKGIIANNTAAVDGGGMYIASGGFVELLTGTVWGNTAGNNGGGIWVAYANLNHLFVYNGMAFSNNRASIAYNRNPIDDALYYAQIGPNITWTTPFTQGYNNYDISYTNGVPFALYNVTVNDSYALITGAGNYQAGETVTINAGTRSGYTFINWTINQGNITLTLPNTPIATFTMPESNVVVTANWQADQPLSGTFSVTKLTNPPNTLPVFNFVTSTGGSFSLSDDGSSWFSGEVPSGVYTVTELPTTGWELTSVKVGGTSNYTLNLGTGTLTFVLEEGQDIELFFVNTERMGPEPGSFSVTKLTNPPNDNVAFNFITSAPGGTFSLTDANSWSSGMLPPGNYTLTEIAQPDWDLANIIINDPTNNSRVDLATRTVFIALDPGETITILYQNTKQTPQTGSISVVKTTCPTEASAVFNFVTSISPGTFSLTDGTTWNSGPLAPGNYTLTEIAQAGWDLANIIINDPTNNSRVDLASRTVFIALDPGETITILYQNTQQTPDQGSFSITKVTCPVDSFDMFRFVTSAPGGSFSLTDGQSWSSGMLPPGTYTVTELVPPGWEITNILLDDPSGASSVDLSTGTATITLQAGTHVSIVYQDAQTPPQGGLISVVKAACPTDTSAQFTFVSSASEGTFSLGNGEVWNSGELAPGRYLVTEVLQVGWVISDIVVVDPSGTSTADLSTGTATINLQAGTHVTIIYQNTEQTRPDCCNQCNKDPCQCPPCGDCYQKPCVCKPCGDCYQKPCVCKPCGDCHQKPCVCKPCSDCQGLHRYEVFDISLTWCEAQVFCENLGGHLATITSQQESD